MNNQAAKEWHPKNSTGGTEALILSRLHPSLSPRSWGGGGLHGVSLCPSLIPPTETLWWRIDWGKKWRARVTYWDSWLRRGLNPSLPVPIQTLELLHHSGSSQNDTFPPLPSQWWSQVTRKMDPENLGITWINKNSDFGRQHEDGGQLPNFSLAQVRMVHSISCDSLYECSWCIQKLTNYESGKLRLQTCAHLCGTCIIEAMGITSE